MVRPMQIEYHKSGILACYIQLCRPNYRRIHRHYLVRPTVNKVGVVARPCDGRCLSVCASVCTWNILYQNIIDRFEEN